MDRIPGAGIEEILLATNPNMEGDATASYLNELLKKEGIRTTRIAHGVTVGSTSNMRINIRWEKQFAPAYRFRI